MTDPQKTSFVLGMIWKMNEKQEIEFLVLDVISTHPATGRKSENQTKFPGGKNRIPDEPLDVMLLREILEETYLACLPDKARLVWQKELPVVGGEQHTKYGYLLAEKDCRGELRKERVNDNGDDMSPPYWEPLWSLKFKLFGGHQPALLAAMAHLNLP